MTARIVLLVLGTLVGASSSYVFHGVFHGDDISECASKYMYLNGRTVCAEHPVIRKTSYYETVLRIDALIDTHRERGIISEGAVFFRDLRSGPTFGIDERTSFAPASLLKLPVALVFMNAADAEPEVLNAELSYTGDTLVSDQGVKPTESAQPGRAYPIRELLRLMLTHSDNASYQALEAFLGEQPQREALRLDAFRELGFIDPDTREERTLSVRAYAAIFTLLHNASYLTAESSNLILSWLAESPFTDALVTGVPADVPVAHKFGERLHDDGTKELHDCGIIYFPDNPYVLCVMTNGTDWAEQRKLIAEISRIVYEEVASRAL